MNVKAQSPPILSRRFLAAMAGNPSLSVHDVMQAVHEACFEEFVMFPPICANVTAVDDLAFSSNNNVEEAEQSVRGHVSMLPYSIVNMQSLEKRALQLIWIDKVMSLANGGDPLSDSDTEVSLKGLLMLGCFLHDLLELGLCFFECRHSYLVF